MTALPVVLIIGASRGLGLALAREWLSRGWTVIATASLAAVFFVLSLVFVWRSFYGMRIRSAA